MSQEPNSRYELFSRGIYVDPMVAPSRLQALAERIRPIKSNVSLIRVGAEEDGGYLIPDDLQGINICFSPGVDQVASFEAGLLKFGIRSHLADYSVDKVPQGVSVASFTKKFIGANDNDQFISMESWIRGVSEYGQTNDLLLQMDIEGGEYESLLSIPNDILARFRIAAIEFHNIETWSQGHYLSLVEATFEKLLKVFHVVHNHPNNAMGIVDMNGFLAPRVFELTLLRKDRVGTIEGFATLPHPLDRPNIPRLPDIQLPANWVQ